MVGAEDDDGVACEAGVVQRFQQVAEAVVQRGAMRVVAGQVLSRLFLHVLGHVRAQLELVGVVHGAVLRRGCLVRIVRRAPGQEQHERFVAARVVLDVLHRVLRLGDRVITGPGAFRRIVAGVVERVIVVVRTFEHFPVVESLSRFGRDVVASPAAVEVPLADVAGVIAGGPEHFREAGGVVAQVQVVQEHAVRERELPGHQGCAMRAAHRAAGDGVGEVDRLISEAIEVGRLDIGITGVTGRRGAPLVG